MIELERVLTIPHEKSYFFPGIHWTGSSYYSFFSSGAYLTPNRLSCGSLTQYLGYFLRISVFRSADALLIVRSRLKPTCLRFVQRKAASAALLSVNVFIELNRVVSGFTGRCYRLILFRGTAFYKWRLTNLGATLARSHKKRTRNRTMAIMSRVVQRDANAKTGFYRLVVAVCLMLQIGLAKSDRRSDFNSFWHKTDKMYSINWSATCKRTGTCFSVQIKDSNVFDYWFF